MPVTSLGGIRVRQKEFLEMGHCNLFCIVTSVLFAETDNKTNLYQITARSFCELRKFHIQYFLPFSKLPHSAVYIYKFNPSREYPLQFLIHAYGIDQKENVSNDLERGISSLFHICNIFRVF